MNPITKGFDEACSSGTSTGFTPRGDCNCEAVTDLAHERTELMEEMAAALEIADRVVRIASINNSLPWYVKRDAIAAVRKTRAVLAKYRGEGATNAGG